MSNEPLELAVNGELLQGWKDVTVSRAIDRLAGAFSVTLSDAIPDDPRARKLLRGDRVEIRLAGAPVLEGIVNRRTKDFDGTSSSISIAGRGLAADLVDASVTVEPGEWSGASVETIAEAIIAPFSIRFRHDLTISSSGSAEKFAIQTGESAFSALDRLARMRGLLVASDAGDGIYFTRPARTSAPVALERGANLEAGTVVDDDSERFDRYIVNGQGPSLSWWDVGEGPGQSFRAEASDPGIGRPRPLVIQAESGAGGADLERRAVFESTSRAARGVRVSYTLPGWTLEGHLFTPGELVSVFDPILEVGTAAGAPVDLLVGSVEWSRGSTTGSRTRLELMRPGAFSLEPIVAPPREEGLPNWL